MKKTLLSILAIAAIAGLAVWMLEGSGLATHNPNAGYDGSNIGATGDSVNDGAPEKSGYDRQSDRTPDSDPDRNVDLVPDCDDGVGDGNCGNGTFGGDSTPDNLSGPGEGDALGGNGDGTPDLLQAPGFDRVGDKFRQGTGRGDGTPDHASSDGVPDRQGGARDCIPADILLGECDQNTTDGPKDGNNDPFRYAADRVGRDGNVSSADRGTATAGDNTSDRSAVDIAAGSDNPGRPDRDGDSNGSGCDGGTCDDSTSDRGGPTAGDGSGDCVGCGDATPDKVAERRVTDRTNRDRIGDQVLAANADNTPDGVQDRNLAGNSRDSGQLNHSQPARDAFPTGPRDRTKDNFMGSGDGPGSGGGKGSKDRGGFGLTPVTTGGGGGGGSSGGGCSLVPYSQADPVDAVAYLAVLLSPVALVQLRRFVRKK